MTEDKAQYTAGGKVTPDNVNAAMRQITENYIAQLERTIDGYNMIQHRHAETITEQKRRIAELEAEVNLVLRKLDAVPVDALRRLVEYTEFSDMEEYPVNQHIADYNAAIAYFRKMDGAA